MSRPEKTRLDCLALRCQRHPRKETLDPKCDASALYAPRPPIPRMFARQLESLLELAILREPTIVRTYGTHENPYISACLLSIFEPDYYNPS